ncbi:type II toxin-antitoxin system RelE/ParE family toxin [bacterium]|nr:MAG: type II toxin-antitoxin system RelE/ParE family toxin [bacterium]
MARIFKDEGFAKRARKARISNEALRDAVVSADSGLVDAYLGGELIKQRIAREGEGKSGGFRTVLAFRREDRAFFVHMFAKNDEANISSQDLEALKVYARTLLRLTEPDLARALDEGVLEEIE